MIPNRLTIPRRAPAISCILSDQVIAEDQIIHAAAHEGAVCLRQRVDDRFAFEIEGGVEDHGDARRFAETTNEIVLSWAPFPDNRLELFGAVNMGDRWNDVAFGLEHPRDNEHEPGRTEFLHSGSLEEVGGSLG